MGQKFPDREKVLILIMSVLVLIMSIIVYCKVS